jgi:hypothetical protein
MWCIPPAPDLTVATTSFTAGLHALHWGIRLTFVSHTFGCPLFVSLLLDTGSHKHCRPHEKRSRLQQVLSITQIEECLEITGIYHPVEGIDQIGWSLEGVLAIERSVLGFERTIILLGPLQCLSVDLVIVG